MPDTKLLQDDYDDGLIRQFFRTARAFSRTLNGAVSQEDIHSSEWMVLNLTARHPGIMQGELIQRLGVEPAAISRTLTRLEKKGIICRETGRERGNAIRLTAKGETAVKKLSRPVTEHRQQALQGFSMEEREQLMSFMMRMADNLQQK
ncbi:MAG: MarR family transcriptional regulator [Selenomonas sp.]|nr:MarR family transcriptional regulator [Selenomonas sp.]